MAKKKLSAIALSTLPPGTYFDHVVPGLEFVVGKNRRKFRRRYRSGGRYLAPTLGYFPSMGLQAARDAARSLIERVDSGTAATPAAVHPRSALTLGQLIDKYEALRQAEGHRTKVLSASMVVLRRQLEPWLSLPAAQFSKADLRTARDALIKTGNLVSANRLLGYLGPVMRWGAQEDLIATNFVRDVRRSPERKRSRVLSAKELVAIWQSCDRLGTGASAKAFGRLVRFLTVTAQRKSEGRLLRHRDIVDGTWRQSDNKSDRPHSLKLPQLALDLIGKGEPQELVFAGTTGTPLGNFTKTKNVLDRVSGVTDWRLHDLRRTAATNMQNAGIRNEVVQGVLNHLVPGVGQVYLRATFEKEKAAALTAWAAALSRIVRPMRLVAP